MKNKKEFSKGILVGTVFVTILMIVPGIILILMFPGLDVSMQKSMVNGLFLEFLLDILFIVGVWMWEDPDIC